MKYVSADVYYYWLSSYNEQGAVAHSNYENPSTQRVVGWPPFPQDPTRSLSSSQSVV